MTRFDQVFFLSLLATTNCLNITTIPLLEITEDGETTRPPLLAMTEQGLIEGKNIITTPISQIQDSPQKLYLLCQKYGSCKVSVKYFASWNTWKT